MKDSTGYQLLKRYTLFVFKNFYQEIIIKGEENLPKDNSAVIFAPNHLNALMDALAASYIVPRNQTVVYLARADLFRKKTLAKIMNFVNILPAFRMRDGIDKLNKNEESFSSSVDALENGKYVCIMPEGGQGEERKIRPLVKGIFRIAFSAQERFGNDRKVKIIPLGLDLSDLEKANSDLIINIGEPIEIDLYFEKYKESPNVAVNEIRDELHFRLTELTRNYATSKYYSTFETVSDVITEKRLSEKEYDKWEAFKIKQEVGKQLLAIENENSSLMDELEDNVEKYRQYFDKSKLSSIIFTTFDEKGSFFRKSLALLITLPLFFFGFITNALPYLLTKLTRKLLKIEYAGFNSSVSFVLAAIFYPILYILQAVIFHKLFFNSLILSLLFLLLQFFTRSFTLKWIGIFKEIYHISRFNKLLSKENKASRELNQAIFYRNKIIQLYNHSK